jgi:proteasome lid subunit RPN8/RPN11
MIVTCRAELVTDTLGHLVAAGRRHCECVVLWLGRRDGMVVRIEDAYLPLHSAKADMFWIPPEGMVQLHGVLRRRRLMVAAQVHSHPREAFHSEADDRWAIIRHEDALSLVVPYFATQTTVSNFLENTKVFRFSPTAEWIEIPRGEIEQSWLQIS